MKYYLIIIQNQSTQAIFSYDTISEALVRFHNELAYRADDRVSTFCMIIDPYGNVLKKDIWEKETPIEDEK